MKGEIFVVTGRGHGHLHPCMQLCNHLSKRNFKTTLIISSILSSSIPSSFTQNPLISVASISPSPPPIPGSDFLASRSAQDLHLHLLNRFKLSDSAPPLCAVVDFQMGWTKELFWKFDIPVVSLFTFSAAAAAMEWGAWKVQAGDLVAGETRLIPGLPREMAITYWDLKRKTSGSGAGRGPPKPGDRPPWVPQIEGSIGLMFNTSDDLDGVFIKYMEDEMALPAWGVGPLLPDKYWKPSDALIRDREITEHKRESNATEDQVIQWLDSKPRGAVLYVAFGSEVGPTPEEFDQLANGLEDSTRPFIWVVREEMGYYPNGLEKRVGERGLIINGWASQLMILSHSSTGGFVSHCGWNSTMEAIGLGVPILAWPIRGDQYYNAKLVVDYLNLGYRVAHDLSESVNKYDIVQGIEKLMRDEEMHAKANVMKAKLRDYGFPPSAEAAVNAFTQFIIK